MSAVSVAALQGRSGDGALANPSARPTIAPRKPVERDQSRACVDCGALVVRARHAPGPLPARCPACSASHRPLVQLRAYLRTAARLAQALGLTDVADAVTAAVTVLDAPEIER